LSDIEIEEPVETLLISPNLGNPLILEIDRKLKNKEFQTSLLYVCSDVNPEIIKQTINTNLSLIPLFDYKWSYKLAPKVKKKGFFARWKEKRKKKKLKKEGKVVDTEAKLEGKLEILKKLKARLQRGNPISPNIITIEEAPTNSISNVSYIDNPAPQEYLLRNHVYENLGNFYRVVIEFTLSKEILNFLKERQFLMFDITSSDGRVNYHSLVISKQKWKNFTFAHATDLHLAERNDRIYGIVKNWTHSSVMGGVDEFFKAVKKKLKLFSKKKPSEKELTDIKTPLRKRLINPNNQFRKFIKICNRKVLRNELDFIVLTGDLIDYTILSKLSKKLRKLNEFKYENSNWKTFKSIILNTPSQEKQKGILRGEELNCPIFTTLGNHDYRPFHYDLTWGEMYKKIGLNASEAVALNELFSASPISAITKSSLALKGYLSEFNPFYDFYLQLGNNLFIVLNTGSDSFKNLRDLITGHPSVTGVSIKQIKYLENLMNAKFNENTNAFLFLHGPPVNTGVKKFKLNLFEKKGSRFIRSKVSEFKESLVKRLGKPLSNARIDGVFNVKYGGVSSNWEKLIEFCKNFTVMTLCGHTHDNQEFRLADPGENKTSVYDAPPFRLQKIQNPAAIYYDDYSEILTDAKSIRSNGPYVVQTPALGLGSYRHPETAGAYREITVNSGKITSFKVKYINR
jgi:Icc-related predicted phosphoesterase